MESKSSSSSSSSEEGVSITVTADKEAVLVSVKTPEAKKRTPLDICCVVDVSGSMGTEATLKTATGDVESHGLSLLDIVKHAVRTIVASLQSSDRLSLVVYATSARTITPLTAMSDAAKAKVNKELDKLGDEDSTNLWGGLEMGLDVLRNAKEEDKKKGSSGPERLSACLLLTDGLPNVTPQGGELNALKQYKDKHRHLSCTISTFGFGYSINSELLRNIAIEGGGMYSFIPDSSFVGTTFVHAVSNLLVTMATQVHLSIEPQNGAKIVEKGVPGGLPSQVTSWGVSIDLCSLQYGQTKDVVILMSNMPSDSKPYLTATLKYFSREAQKDVEVSVDGSKVDGGAPVQVQHFRLKLVDNIREAMDILKTDNNGNKKALDYLSKLIQEMQASSDKQVAPLLQDLKGQVVEAVSRSDYYKKWGQHYLPSLMRAHLLQQCNNFKDPGIQGYGGKLFGTIRDEVDAIFCKLPPPKPTIKKSSGHSYSAPSSMSVYNSSANPCFSGECTVKMYDGTHKKVSAVAMGDQVMTPNRSAARVLCVVKTLCKETKADLVKLPGGLVVTPYHPIRLNGTWHFPCDVGRVTLRSCDAVYCFVLDSQHIMIINDVECVTLGHDLQDNDVVAHPYFGSTKVVEDLKKMSGWESGLIQFNAGCMVRDPITGLVCGFSP